MTGLRSVHFAVLLLATLTSAAQNLQPAPDSGPTTFGGGTYSYDPAGNIIAIDNQYFLYDTTGRLTQASVMAPDRSMVTQSYTYDVYGNLLTLARTGVTQTMTVDITNNHLMNGSVDYDYDPAGNLLSWTPPGTSTTYQYGWDGLGNLQSIRLANQPVTDPPAVAYLYTASDERISTFDVPNQASHWMIRDLGGQVLTDFFDNQGTWSWTRDYFYRDGTMLASTLPNIVQHYTVDHLGSPRLITDDSANRIAAQTFLPFGEELQATFANGASIKKFTSHERDSDPGLTGTSLDYMHARYMNGLTGRFMSADPVLDLQRALPRPQMWNRYAYVTNNPINATDPDGRAEDLKCSTVFYKCSPEAQAAYDHAATQALKADLLVAGAVVGAEAWPVVSRLGMALAVRFPTLTDAVRGWLQGETGTPSVNLGSGAKPIEGAINVDIPLSEAYAGRLEQIQVGGNMLQLPFKNGSVGNVTAQNIPSPLLGMNGSTLAGELGRTMKSGSTLTITTRTPGALQSFAQLLGKTFKEVVIKDNVLTAIRK